MSKKDNIKKSTSVSFEPAVLAWLKAEAKRLDRSVSWIINNMVKEKSERSE